MKSQRFSRGIALLFVKLGTRWRWVVNSTPRTALPQGMRSFNNFTRTRVGPRAGLDGCRKSRPYRVFFPFPLFPFDPFCTSKSLRPSSCHLRSILLSLYNKPNTNIHALGGIRTRNPSKRAAADPRRPLGSASSILRPSSP